MSGHYVYSPRFHDNWYKVGTNSFKFYNDRVIWGEDHLTADFASILNVAEDRILWYFQDRIDAIRFILEWA
jgi:hypothetical protein